MSSNIKCARLFTSIIPPEGKKTLSVLNDVLARNVERKERDNNENRFEVVNEELSLFSNLFPVLLEKNDEGIVKNYENSHRTEIRTVLLG